MVTTSPLSDKGLNGELKMRANPKSANEATQSVGSHKPLEHRIRCIESI